MSPSIILPNFREIIPSELRERNQWVMWRYEEKTDAKGKVSITKIPYTWSGVRASSTDSDTWTSFNQAVMALERVANAEKVIWNGVGFVFSKNDPYAGIDFDNCISGDGTVKPWADPFLRYLEGTYMETSPSGTRVKIWVRGEVERGFKKELDGQGESDDKKEAIEVYSWGRFFTVTGNMRGTFTAIEDHQLLLDRFHRWAKPPAQTKQGGSYKNGFQPSAQYGSGDQVPHGDRHNVMVSLCGNMRSLGVAEEIIAATLHSFNDAQCGKPTAEVDQIISSTRNWGAN